MRDRSTMLWLDPRELIEDPENVRHDTPDLEGLAESIRQYGVLQPLGVARHAERHHVVYGTRRRRAAIMAGLEVVPCLELTGDRLVCQLLENLQRAELNDMEKAEGFARLKEQLALHNRELGETRLDELTARTLGVSPSTIRRYIRLRELPTGLRALLRSGELNVTQAQHLFAVPEPAKQEELGRLAAEQGLSAAAIARASGLLASRPGLMVAEALSGVESGALAPRMVASAPTKIAPRPTVNEGIDEDRELWGDEAVTDDDLARAAREARRGVGSDGFGDPTTADGNRVFRIQSVDAFCDEVARIARCVADGDLAGAIKRDPKSGVKLELARRQLEYVLGAISQLPVK